jgi:NAD(P)-dependent dehydrogenase (short-subunit alcohol dehydrogenase family)
MRRKLRDSVVVITGASSGIGRATALRFAEKGATVVLAARREAQLREVERQCVERGGRALAVPTDVTKEKDVQALAKKAVETFGRIDVWVNNAAVTMFGRFEESPMEDYEQVIRTNLFGYIYGARAALPVFREQGEGVLINNASIVGMIAQPYTSAYAVSKFGIRGLTEGLRMELMDAPRIHACTVLPATIDTPFFQHAANFTGRRVRAMDPVYPPEQVAEAIVKLARRPRREVMVGAAGRMLLSKRLMPGFAERLMARKVEHSHLEDTADAESHGNLFRPMVDEEDIHGGWMQEGRRGNRGVRLLKVLLLLAVPLALFYVWQRRARDRRGIVQHLPGFRRQAAFASLPLLGWFTGRRSRLRRQADQWLAPLSPRKRRWLPAFGRRRAGWLPEFGRTRGSWLPGRRQAAWGAPAAVGAAAMSRLRGLDSGALAEHVPTRKEIRKAAEAARKRLPDEAQLRRIAEQAMERLPDRKDMRQLARSVPTAKEARKVLERQSRSSRRQMKRMMREVPELQDMPAAARERLMEVLPASWRR